jgi:hypothetical protein
MFDRSNIKEGPGKKKGCKDKTVFDPLFGAHQGDERHDAALLFQRVCVIMHGVSLSHQFDLSDYPELLDCPIN